MTEQRTTYLLPCTCGRENPIESRQAGESVRCACGRLCPVPTLREVKSLRRAPASSQPAPAAAATWGRPQRFLVIGLLIVVLAALAASALYHQLPPRFPGLPSAEAERQRVAAMPIREMRRYYYQWLLPGLDVAEPPEIQQRRNRIYLGLGTLAVFGVIGAIFAGAGVVGMVRRGVQ